MSVCSFRSHLTALRKKVKPCPSFLEQGAKERDRRCYRVTIKNKASSSRLHASSLSGIEVSNQFKRVFGIIDTNRDGKISPCELSRVIQRLSGCEESVAEAEAEFLVREMDEDGDGMVDVNEFVSALLHDNGEAMETDEHSILWDAFVVFDTDNNGLISAEELQKVLAGIGWEDCGLSDCARMIHAADKNGDGFIDFDEFCSMLDGC